MKNTFSRRFLNTVSFVVLSVSLIFPSFDADARSVRSSSRSKAHAPKSNKNARSARQSRGSRKVARTRSPSGNRNATRTRSPRGNQKAGRSNAAALQAAQAHQLAIQHQMEAQRQAEQLAALCVQQEQERLAREATRQRIEREGDERLAALRAQQEHVREEERRQRLTRAEADRQRIEREGAEQLAALRARHEQERLAREAEDRQRLAHAGADLQRIEREGAERLAALHARHEQERLARQEENVRAAAQRQAQAQEREPLRQQEENARAEAQRQEQAQAQAQERERLRQQEADALRVMAARQEAHNHLDELSRTIRANANIGIGQDMFVQTFERLKTYPVASLPLVTAIIKRVEFKVNDWSNKALGGQLTEAQSDQLFKDMISCNRMITNVLENPGVPTEDQLPQRLKINPWMINSPYEDIINNKQSAQSTINNIDAAPNQQLLTNALNKIGNLFDRLEREKQIKPIRLLDYESVHNDIKRSYEENSALDPNRYKNILRFVKVHRPEEYVNLPFAGKINITGAYSGIFNKSNRTKNRAIALASLIWKQDENNQEVQVLSDETAGLMLTRLAIGGRHCSVRAENDTSWVVAKASSAFVAESNEILEIKVASLMGLTKRKAINAMVVQEEDVRASQIAHLQMLIEKRLDPYIGIFENAGTFQDNYDFFPEYVRRPIETVLQQFYAKFTQKLMEKDLAADVTKGISRQGDGIIKMQDIMEYVDRTTPGRDYEEGIMGYEDDDITVAFKRPNARAVLYGLGYLEEDD